MILREADERDLDIIEKRLVQHLPESKLLLGALKAKKKYKGLWDVSGTRLFISDQSSLIVASPACSQEGRQCINFFWDRYKEDDSEIGKLLSQIPNVDWHKPVFILAAPLPLMDKVQKLIADTELGGGILKPFSKGEGHLYSLDTDALEIPSLPGGLEIRMLSQKDAQHTYGHWDYSFSESFECYKQFIDILPGVGIFTADNEICHLNADGCSSKRTTETDSTKQAPDSSEDNWATVTGEKIVNQENAIAWTHLSPLNLITNTFTLPEFRGKGLAKIATLTLAKEAFRDTGVVNACVTQGHVASIKMHEKLGFTSQYAIGYQYFGVPNENSKDTSTASSRWMNE